MGTVYEDVCTFFIIFRWILLRMRNISDKICKKNHTTHFMLIIFFPENLTLCKILWKNVVQLDRPLVAIKLALYMLDNWGYKHTLGKCNTYCFPTATLTRLNVKFYVYWLSCLYVTTWRCAGASSFISNVCNVFIIGVVVDAKVHTTINET
jgi:hypothetical protein